MDTFAERLRQTRKDKQMTQEDLAKKVGVNKQSISQYERGVRRPDLDILSKIAQELALTTDYLIGKNDEPVFYLTDDEKHLLIRYRGLDDDTQEMVRKFFDYIDELRGKGHA